MLHSPRADRITDMTEVTPRAISVQTQKSFPPELAILPPTSPEQRDDVSRSAFCKYQYSAQPNTEGKYATDVLEPNRFKTADDVV